MIDIALIVIKTDKLQEQHDFYSMLGFQFEYHKQGSGPYHYTSHDSKAVLEIYPLPKGVSEPDNTTRLGFTVEDLDLVIGNLKSSGIRISEPAQTEWGYTVIVHDCDGRKIELTEKFKK